MLQVDNPITEMKMKTGSRDKTKTGSEIVVNLTICFSAFVGQMIVEGLIQAIII